MSKKQKTESKTKQQELTDIEETKIIQQIATPIKKGTKHPNGRYKYQVVFDQEEDTDIENYVFSEDQLKINHDYLVDLVFLKKKDNIVAYNLTTAVMITEELPDEQVEVADYVEHEPTQQPNVETVQIDNDTDVAIIEGDRHVYQQNSPALSGNMPLKITFEDVKEHLAPDNATDSEVKLFIQFCLTNQLDPFANDAYIIKYNKNQAASFQVSKDLYLKRADQLPDYRGFEAGIIVFNPKTKSLEEREGSFYMKAAGENLVGAYAVVYREGMKPFKMKISRDEYDKKQFIWADKPATMLRKVAIAQALRDAFPNAYAGLYMQEEMTDN